MWLAIAPDPRSAVARFVLLGAILGFSAPAASQDEQEALAAKIQALRAEAGEYLKKHPVKQSLLFDSVAVMIGTLGQKSMMAVGACDFDPLFRDWTEALGPLKENSRIFLEIQYLNGRIKEEDIMPANQAALDRSLCGELKRDYNFTLRELKKFAPALRKAGY